MKHSLKLELVELLDYSLRSRKIEAAEYIIRQLAALQTDSVFDNPALVAYAAKGEKLSWIRLYREITGLRLMDCKHEYDKRYQGE